MDDEPSETVCHFAHPLEYTFLALAGAPEGGPSKYPTLYFQVRHRASWHGLRPHVAHRLSSRVISRKDDNS